MSVKVIGVIQVKGGAGRSTVSTNLVGELAKLAKTVLIDCDMPQGTSASWYAVRQEAGKAAGLHCETASSYRELVALVDKHAKADYIVIDGPPRIAELTKATLVLADLCLIPVGASKAEIWATSDILALIKEANAVKQVKARLLWTRYRPHTNLAKELTALVNQELGLKALDSALGMRVSYVEALGDGLTVTELADQTAKIEVKSLIEEIKKLLKVTP